MKNHLAAALAALLVFAGFAADAQVQPQSAATPTSEAQAQVKAIDNPGELLTLAKQYEAEQNWANAALAWQKLQTLNPHNPGAIYNLAVNYAQANDMARAYHVLLVSQRAGLGFELTADSRFANLHGTEVWDYLVELHRAAIEDSFGEGSVAFEIPPADRLLESIAHDPLTGNILLAGARDGVIYRRSRSGKLDVWTEPQGDMWWSIFDLKVDSARKHLWATSAAVPHFKGYKAEMAGRSALLKIDLVSGELIQAYPAPADGLPHILNSIAVSSKGMVIVAEGMRGQLFKLEGDALQPLMAEPRLNSLRGIVFSADDKILYFADYERGLFGLDLARGSAFDVAYPQSVILYGIEGIYLYDNQLVAIQNGITPQRVMRFKLSPDGHSIEMGVPLDSANPAFATPTLGTLVDDELFFIANSQRSYYDSYGLRKGSLELPPTRIFSSDVRFNWDFKPPSLPASLAPKPAQPAADTD